MNELKRIITTEKKIREITHELRDWLTINKERIHLLFEYISNILKEKDNEKLSFDYIFILFCCSGDSISRSNNIYLKEDNWERLLKILLIKIKLYSKIIQIEKYESTLIKYTQFCQSKGILILKKKRKHSEVENNSSNSTTDELLTFVESRRPITIESVDDIFALLSPIDESSSSSLSISSTTTTHDNNNNNNNNNNNTPTKLNTTSLSSMSNISLTTPNKRSSTTTSSTTSSSSGTNSQKKSDYSKSTTSNHLTPSIDSLTSSLSRCNYDTCVIQSYLGNSYHTYRTAVFLNHISKSLALPTRILSISLEILHNLTISIIQQSNDSTTTRYSSTRLSPQCPLWSYDETAVVSIASICMACKIVSDEMDVPRKNRIIEASDSVSTRIPIFRSPVDISSLLKKYETKIVKALHYDFQFTTLRAQIQWCGPILLLSPTTISSAISISQHEVFLFSNLTARYPLPLLALVCIYLSYSPAPIPATIQRWFSKLTIVNNSPFTTISSVDLLDSSQSNISSEGVIRIAQEATYLKDYWLPLMKEEMKREEEQNERKRSELLNDSKNEVGSKGMSLIQSLISL